jgi:uncharacterized membrane protein YidH (DUF202 family)
VIGASTGLFIIILHFLALFLIVVGYHIEVPGCNRYMYSKKAVTAEVSNRNHHLSSGPAVLTSVK